MRVLRLHTQFRQVQIGRTAHSSELATQQCHWHSLPRHAWSHTPGTTIQNCIAQSVTTRLHIPDLAAWREPLANITNRRRRLEAPQPHVRLPSPRTMDCQLLQHAAMAWDRDRQSTAYEPRLSTTWVPATHERRVVFMFFKQLKKNQTNNIPRHMKTT